MISYITNELHCDVNKEMDNRSLNALLCYVKGLKIDFMIPNQPNTKRSYNVVGVLDTAVKFLYV